MSESVVSLGDELARSGGVDLPLCAQNALWLLRVLPRTTARYPRSAEFRMAMRALWGEQSVYFSPTRGDIEMGLRTLDRYRLLPSWVVWGGRRSDGPGAA